MLRDFISLVFVAMAILLGVLESRTQARPTGLWLCRDWAACIIATTLLLESLENLKFRERRTGAVCLLSRDDSRLTDLPFARTVFSPPLTSFHVRALHTFTVKARRFSVRMEFRRTTEGWDIYIFCVET
jgi:hypothetical protein